VTLGHGRKTIRCVAFQLVTRYDLVEQAHSVDMCNRVWGTAFSQKLTLSILSFWGWGLFWGGG